MTELFDRFWSLTIKDVRRGLDFTIKQDEFGNALRVKFTINATFDLRYYTGEIKIYNLEPTKRKDLVFNLLKEDFGTGPAVQLDAGYQQKHGLIFDGAVTRGFTIREPSSGDWITTLQVGLPFKQDKQITIQSIPITNTTLLGFLKSTISTIINQPDRVAIEFNSNYNANFKAAIDDYFAAGNTLNEDIGYSGSSMQIINEIQNRFNLYFYKDSEGFNVVGGKYKTSSDPRVPLVLPQGNTVPELLFSKDTGLIGSPIYTDTGAKIVSYLKPEVKMFQWIDVQSDILNKQISVLELIHRGDTMTDEWYSEIDGSNFNQLIKEK